MTRRKSSAKRMKIMPNHCSGSCCAEKLPAVGISTQHMYVFGSAKATVEINRAGGAGAGAGSGAGAGQTDISGESSRK